MNPETLSLLSQLRDIHQPDTGGFAIAPVWFVVAFLLLFLVLGVRSLLTRYLHARAAQQWRGDAREELRGIRERQQQQAANVTVAECSGLLRRIALAVKPRADVAAITGQQWLTLLDQVHGSNAFSESYSPLLLESPYRNPRQAQTYNQTQADKVSGLLDLTSELIDRASPAINKAPDAQAD